MSVRSWLTGVIVDALAQHEASKVPAPARLFARRLERAATTFVGNEISRRRRAGDASTQRFAPLLQAIQHLCQSNDRVGERQTRDAELLRHVSTVIADALELPIAVVEYRIHSIQHAAHHDSPSVSAQMLVTSDASPHTVGAATDGSEPSLSSASSVAAGAEVSPHASAPTTGGNP